jgi:hypothetical protein
MRVTAGGCSDTPRLSVEAVVDRGATIGGNSGVETGSGR